MLPQAVVEPFVKSFAMPRVKICCISSLEEVRMALAAGASALGLVSQMPSGPGVISETPIAQIAATVSAPTDTFWGTFLLTCQQYALDASKLAALFAALHAGSVG
jgi:phosphoribosylanthranilate isomerase